MGNGGNQLGERRRQLRTQVTRPGKNSKKKGPGRERGLGTLRKAPGGERGGGLGLVERGAAVP